MSLTSSLTSLIFTIAQTVQSAPAGAAPGTGGATPPPNPLLFLYQYGAVIIGVLLLFVFSGGTKKKQERERKALLDNLKRGDKIRLIGGEFGAVVDVRDSKVLVKVDEGSNTKIWYARDAVQGVERDEPAAAAK